MNRALHALILVALPVWTAVCCSYDHGNVWRSTVGGVLLGVAIELDYRKHHEYLMSTVIMALLTLCGGSVGAFTTPLPRLTFFALTVALTAFALVRAYSTTLTPKAPHHDND